MENTVFTAKGITKIYKTGDQKIYALDGVDLTINKGEMVSITGKSGSGKSTLMHILGGLDKPTEGSLFLGNTQLDNLKDKELSKIRREKIGFVFQKFCLVQELTVLENICLPISLCNKKPDEKYINNICEILGLSHRKSHLPSQLSGGQQQRTAIARAIANDPEIILCDEPTGNLDECNSNEVIELLCKINKEYKKTILIVTHDNSISEKCGRCIRLCDGRVV